MQREPGSEDAAGEPENENICRELENEDRQPGSGVRQDRISSVPSTAAGSPEIV